ncbi:hypothetical protein GCM10011391_06930 [Pullulanibacillus camelliae]|uniref:DUF1806 family protein n=1 Tax=Pullulanibacillus camelliae TaxID=1707096 RepID=A0A8J2YB15_9BACL|nr:YojF family protein [Pullulanibacillus camelliae]GGE30902.1 hypothetical protein GCM10011391_06930 [Pullulanibacillus camelliae]
MEAIQSLAVQEAIEGFINQEVYLHLETTTGSYASLSGDDKIAVVAFIRNGKVRFHQAKITGTQPYRVGLKLEEGWVYAEGLTDWELRKGGDQLLLAGHDQEGQLLIALELSHHPFNYE